MNKKMLVKYVSGDLKTTKKDAKKIVRSVMDGITSGILQGERKVELPDFGKFIVREMKPARRRNPATGETFIMDSYKKVVFKPAKHLRDRVRNGSK